MFKRFLKYLSDRAREPSTLAALAVLGVLVGLPPGTVDAAAVIVAGVAGAAAILIPDPKAE